LGVQDSKVTVGPYTITVNASGVQFLTKGSHRIEVKGTTPWGTIAPPTSLKAEYYVLGMSE
jgi:hypothetical protein